MSSVKEKYETTRTLYEDALAAHSKRVLSAPHLSPSSYDVYIGETLRAIKRYSRILRTTIEPEFVLSSNCGQIISIRDFIYYVGSAFFDDPEGYGMYIRGNYISNIEIYPDDVLFGAVRTDFENIIWFNK